MLEPQAKALAELIHHIRPAWSRHGILAIIQHDQRDDETIAIVAIEAAHDRAANSPGVIHKRERSDRQNPPKTRQPGDARACTQCRRIHEPGQTVCKRVDAEITKAGAVRAREALKPTGGTTG